MKRELILILGAYPGLTLLSIPPSVYILLAYMIRPAASKSELFRMTVIVSYVILLIGAGGILGLAMSLR